MVKGISKEYLGSAIFLTDYSAVNPLCSGSPIILFGDIKDAFQNNITANKSNFQTTDFVSDDDESYINKINRHKGYVQFSGFENDIWTINGKFTTSIGSQLALFDDDGETIIGSAYVFSSHILKIMRSHPKTLYLTAENINALSGSYADLPPIYSGSGIPLALHRGEWSLAQDTTRGGGSFRLTFVEDKE